eukprot:4893452-Amphidinium_carterae.1
MMTDLCQRFAEHALVAVVLRINNSEWNGERSLTQQKASSNECSTHTHTHDEVYPKVGRTGTKQLFGACWFSVFVSVTCVRVVVFSQVVLGVLKARLPLLLLLLGQHLHVDPLHVIPDNCLMKAEVIVSHAIFKQQRRIYISLPLVTGQRKGLMTACVACQLR